MWSFKSDESQYQKRAQQVLTKQESSPTSGLNLEYIKPQCYNCKLSQLANYVLKRHDVTHSRASEYTMVRWNP